MSTLKILFKQEMSLSKTNNTDTNTDDITSFCRLCLIKDTEMESLYKPLEEIFEDNVTTLFNIMERLSSTKLSEDPKYPSYLCLTCVSLLNTAYKVNRLLEISQNRLSEIFREDFEINKSQTNCHLDQVEIISDKGKYDLKDVLIIEDNDNQNGNFEGFLNNLGSVISAEFITKDNQKKKKEEDEIHTINIIPLQGSEELEIADIVIEEEVETEKDQEEIPVVESKSNLKCNQCDKVFKVRGNLFRHKKIVHGGKKSYLCQTCGYVTNVRTSLTNHMLLKHQGKRFACELCGKKYLSNSHLQYHMLMHKNERSYLCTVCGKNFNYGSSLEYHMRIHTGEKKYKCTYCDRAFSMRCGLNRHLRTHTGLRPYKCSYCEKAFRSKGEVNCHEMTHTGFRPYHCKLCGKGFTKTHNLKVHMLGHAGPVLCELCHKGFLDNDYLKLHMKVGHGLADYDASNSQILVVGDEADLEELNETLIITTE